MKHHRMNLGCVISQSNFYKFGISLALALLLNACNALKSETLFQKQSADSIRYGEYTVVRGDTLYSIAWRFKRNYKELANINGISEPYTIKIGQVLRLGRELDEIPSKLGYTGQSVVETSGNTRPEKSRNYVEKRPIKNSTAPMNTMKTKGKANRVSALPSADRASTKSDVKWLWPAQGPVIQNFSGSAVGKKGIQIGGNLGDPIRAAASGQVVYSGNGLVGYGNLVIVKHNDAYLTAYAHNQRVLVREGEAVVQGQKIAEMGSSGTDLNKLHFEIRYEGNPVNPSNYLPKR